jgi:hypothetical protein
MNCGQLQDVVSLQRMEPTYTGTTETPHCNEDYVGLIFFHPERSQLTHIIIEIYEHSRHTGLCLLYTGHQNCTRTVFCSTGQTTYLTQRQ